ncbi:MAG: NADH-quinone oxidoreductase subunit NuoH [Actinomycetota bacterium]|nr:NADH-quinone oxidoreductase subunit NuoH [Actinomycetota bacterium]
MIEVVSLVGQASAATFPSILNVSGNLWLDVALKVVAIVALFLVAPLAIGYMEHKVMAHQQARFGPMDVGPHGTLQLVADGVKFMQKEGIVPRAADRWVFGMAPAVSLVAVLVVFLVIPFAPGLWAEDLDLGLFYVLAASSVGVLGVLMAGWASANKFSLIGGVRAAAQLIAYELPMVLAAAAVAIQAGTLSLAGIVEAQATFLIPGTSINVWYVFPQFIGFALFYVAALAELSRPPFDMPIADSELVFGFLTEYTGIRFGLFLLAEYAGMVAFSAILTVLYLGGWQILPGLGVPGCDGLFDCRWWGTLLAFGVTAGKIAALTFTMIWVRVTFPRLREDQLQRLSWLVLIPLSLFNIAVVAAAKVLL